VDEQKDLMPKIQSKKSTIVGIGASAGGLQALRIFFESLPDDTGMAFVVIVHLAPNRKSALPNILQQYTSMPVNQVQERIRVEPNHV
jgi:two-component system CheB/CheR fusion protein